MRALPPNTARAALSIALPPSTTNSTPEVSRPRSARSATSLVTIAAFSVDPSTTPKGDLGAVCGDAERADHQMLAHGEPVEKHDQSALAGQRAGAQLCEPLAVAVTNRRDAADFDVPTASRSTCSPTGSSASG